MKIKGLKFRTTLLTSLLCLGMLAGMTACGHNGTTPTDGTAVESKTTTQESGEEGTDKGDKTEVSVEDSEHMRSLLGDWILIAMKTEGVFSMPEEDNTQSTVSFCEEDGKYYADYQCCDYSVTELYGLKLKEETGSMYDGCENKDWYVSLNKRKEGDVTYKATLLASGDLEIVITSTYNYEDYDTGEPVTESYSTMFFYAPADDSDLETRADRYRYQEDITVSNIKELYEAIGSNRRIILKTGIYNVSDLPLDQRNNPMLNYTGYEEDRYDFPERDSIYVNSAKYLILQAEEGATVEICTDDPFEAPLSFEYGSYIKLINLTLGHHVEPGFCSGNVLDLNGVNNFEIDNCNLYGSGAYGIFARNCYSVHVDDSDIYECTYGIFDIEDCGNWEINNCKLRDSSKYNILDMSNSWDIIYNNCSITGNTCEGDDWSLINCEYAYGIVFNGCTLEDNSYTNFMTGEAEIND